MSTSTSKSLNDSLLDKLFDRSQSKSVRFVEHDSNQSPNVSLGARSTSIRSENFSQRKSVSTSPVEQAQESQDDSEPKEEVSVEETYVKDHSDDDDKPRSKPRRERRSSHKKNKSNSKWIPWTLFVILLIVSFVLLYLYYDKRGCEKGASKYAYAAGVTFLLAFVFMIWALCL